MARVAKPEEKAQKRSEILDAAQKLIYSKGYERMAIQDILDELQISKGAFYHYFDSKQAVLEALVERMSQAAAHGVLPIVQDSKLSALEKFRGYFTASLAWKSHHRPLIMSLLRMWYSDENVRIRQRMASQSLDYMARLLTPVIRQGVAEKVFTTRFPEQVAVIIAGSALSQSDSMVKQMFSVPVDAALLQQVDTMLEAYVDSIERILGAPAGSLQVFKKGAFREWFSEKPNAHKSKRRK
jgi:TetR/AcrR family transcriptional regulator, transcriptional repressor for nem operon